MATLLDAGHVLNQGVLSHLLGVSGEGFLSQQYLRAPYASAGSAHALCPVLDTAMLTRLIGQYDCDLTLVRDGRRAPHGRPRTLPEAQVMHAAGHTLVFRHAERHEPVLAALAGSLAWDLQGTLDVHLYLTPPGHHGFGWHYDAEEVFFIQTAGIKHMYVRANTVHSEPIPETMPSDLGFERETSQILECRLEPGDWLYIPSGWWHMARAKQSSASISFGLLAPTPREIIGAIRPPLANAPAWHRRLPPLETTALSASALVPAVLLDLAVQCGGAATVRDLTTQWLTAKRAYARALMGKF